MERLLGSNLRGYQTVPAPATRRNCERLDLLKRILQRFRLQMGEQTSLMRVSTDYVSYGECHFFLGTAVSTNLCNSVEDSCVTLEYSLVEGR